VDFTSTAANDLQICGPKGKVGRVVEISAMLTTAVTVAASTVLVGTASDTDAYASLTVPIQAINTTVVGADIYTDDDNLIPANSRVVIGNGGGSTAGVGTVTVIIAWF
jgi:hypothetical protein